MDSNNINIDWDLAWRNCYRRSSHRYHEHYMFGVKNGINMITSSLGQCYSEMYVNPYVYCEEKWEHIAYKEGYFWVKKYFKELNNILNCK